MGSFGDVACSGAFVIWVDQVSLRPHSLQLLTVVRNEDIPIE